MVSVFTSAPLTSPVTHRHVWLYLYSERLLLERLQRYRQHLSTQGLEEAAEANERTEGNFTPAAVYFALD